MTVNCSTLAKRTDFNTYGQKLLNATDGHLQLLNQCRNEVCGALWGEGNADISGIGMIVGYILDHLIGLILSALVLAITSQKASRARHVLREGLVAFSNCATFFAFSLELAAIYVLVREDFGISTSGLGDNTVRITQAVGMVVLLALLYPIITFRTIKSHDSWTTDPKEPAAEAREATTRFTLLVLCWALAFYPFFSKMNAAFGPSKIHNQTKTSAHPVLTPEQWAVIHGVCFRDIAGISQIQDDLMTAFVILAYIPLSLFVVGRILWLGVQRNHPDSALHKRLEVMKESVSDRVVHFLPIVSFVAIPLLASGLLWSILFTQQLQRRLTASYGAIDSDNYWTFGQIVSITVFAPVAVECWKSFERHSAKLESRTPAEEDGKLEKGSSVRSSSE